MTLYSFVSTIRAYNKHFKEDEEDEEEDVFYAGMLYWKFQKDERGHIGCSEMKKTWEWIDEDLAEEDVEEWWFSYEDCAAMFDEIIFKD